MDWVTFTELTQSLALAPSPLVGEGWGEGAETLAKI